MKFLIAILSVAFFIFGFSLSEVKTNNLSEPTQEVIYVISTTPNETIKFNGVYLFFNKGRKLGKIKLITGRNTIHKYRFI